jgi:hypothetical protein
MLICVPKSEFKKLEEGEIIALFQEDLFIGYASIFTILESIVILEVSKNIAKLYEDLIKENKVINFHIY